jgi:hypothetical protein
LAPAPVMPAVKRRGSGGEKPIGVASPPISAERGGPGGGGGSAGIPPFSTPPTKRESPRGWDLSGWPCKRGHLDHPWGLRREEVPEKKLDGMTHPPAPRDRRKRTGDPVGAIPLPATPAMMIGGSGRVKLARAATLPERGRALRCGPIIGPCGKKGKGGRIAGGETRWGDPSLCARHEGDKEWRNWGEEFSETTLPPPPSVQKKKRDKSREGGKPAEAIPDRTRSGEAEGPTGWEAS